MKYSSFTKINFQRWPEMVLVITHRVKFSNFYLHALEAKIFLCIKTFPFYANNYVFLYGTEGVWYNACLQKVYGTMHAYRRCMVQCMLTEGVWYNACLYIPLKLNSS